MEEYQKKDKRIKLINQKNSGVSNARNAGISLARGKYITFVDVDDYISNDFISYFYSLIKENNAQIALTLMPRKFNNSTKYNYKKNNRQDIIKICSGKDAALSMLYYKIAIGPWNKLICKDIIDKYKIRFNSNLSFGEGFNFSLDCFQRTDKVVIGSHKVYNYRVDNTNSVMTKFSTKLITGSIEAQKVINKNLVERSKKFLNACKYANWHTYCDCLNTIIGCKMIKQNKIIYKQIKKVCRKDALIVINSPISLKEKIKGIIYFINPYFASKIINNFRIRKFTVK